MCSLRIATLNVLGVQQSLQQLCSVFKEQHLSILAMQSTRYAGGDTTVEGVTFYFSPPSGTASNYGVAFAIHSYNSEHVSVSHRSPRTMLLTIHTASAILHVLNGYAPLADDPDAPLFWEEIDSILTHLPRTEQVVLLGDFNAHMAPEDILNHGHRFSTGTAGHPAASCLNGDSLLSVNTNHNLAIHNFHHALPFDKLYTYRSLSSPNTTSILDYICCSRSKYWHSSATTVSTPRFHTDHRLIAITLSEHLRQDAEAPPPPRPPQPPKAYTPPRDPIFDPLTSALRTHAQTYSAYATQTEAYPRLGRTPSSATTAAIKAWHNAFHANNGILTPQVKILRARARQAAKTDRSRRLHIWLRQVNDSAREHTNGFSGIRYAYRALRTYTRSYAPRRTCPSKAAMAANRAYFRNLLANTNFIPTHHPAMVRITPRNLAELPTVTVHTDGSYSPDTNSGGYGIVTTSPDGTLLARCGGCSGDHTDSYHAELMAIARTTTLFPRHCIHWYTDCQSTIAALHNIHKHAGSEFTQLARPELWRIIYSALLDSEILPYKVQAHQGVTLNEIADRAAKLGSTLPHGSERTITLTPADALLLAGTPHSRLHPDNSPPVQWEIPTPAFKHITPRDDPPDETEIDAAITKLPNHSSPGIDGIKPTSLKRCPETRAVLHQIISLCWEHKRVPRTWNDVILVAIPKKQGGVRGLSLLQSASKVLCNILQQRLLALPLLPSQLGFRPGRSTLHALHALHTFNQNASLRCERGYIAFIDLSKAFDTVDRTTLHRTLEAYAFGPSTRAIIRSMYEDVIYTKTEGTVDNDPFSSHRGVRQGCPLSPLLFVLCMDDCAKSLLTLPSVQALFYADDIALFTHDRQELQTALNTIQRALGLYNMRINTTEGKTAVMVVGQGTNRDTLLGYVRRTHKLQTRIPAPRPEDTCLRNGVLEIPRSQYGSLRCPKAGCPYVASCLLKNRDAALFKHLRTTCNTPNFETRRVVVSRPPIVEDDRDLLSRRALSETTPTEVPFTLVVNQVDTAIDFTTQYRYLGCIVTPSASHSREIGARIAAARRAFGSLRDIWHSRDISRRLRGQLFRTLITPILCYGHEHWTPSEADVHRLEIANNKMLKRAAQVHAVRNADGIWVTGSSTLAHARLSAPTISELLTTGRLRLFGQLRRSRHILPDCCTTASATERNRGTPVHTWDALIAEDLRIRHIADPSLATHKKRWAHAIAYPQ